MTSRSSGPASSQISCSAGRMEQAGCLGEGTPFTHIYVRTFQMNLGNSGALAGCCFCLN